MKTFEQPRQFVRRYADLRASAVEGIAVYADEVRSGVYPAPEHTYAMAEGEAARLTELLAAR